MHHYIRETEYIHYIRLGGYIDFSRQGKKCRKWERSQTKVAGSHPNPGGRLRSDREPG